MTPAQQAKATTARLKRQKETYGMLTKHLLPVDLVENVTNAHFQDGYNAYLMVRAQGFLRVDALKLRKLKADFDAISILHDIGINENTIQLLAARKSAW